MIAVEIISDPICPFCFIAKRRLDRAAERASIEIAPRWRPFQLEPDIPENGADFLERARLRYADTLAHEAQVDRMVTLGKSEGLAFVRDAWARLPQTLSAHRLLRWAGSEGPSFQHAVADRLFVARFEEARDLGDREVLSDIAATILGWSAAQTRARLASDDAVAETIAEARAVRAAGVSGVPLIVIAGRAVSGAQPWETYARLLEAASASA